ncbi:holo-ACP synthase [Methanosphaerula subterraneus]|uniref:holo-ACP synthase n=1 Tax=Methanosphaerula subterraneus TaxID=3350244 RepID=UPI003F834213
MMAKEFLNFGIGVDIENIDRFNAHISPVNEKLLNKIYTKAELDYCHATQNPASHLAVRFAAKEATIKALNTLGRHNIDFRYIEILHDINGVPRVNLKIDNSDRYLSKVSLSHSEDTAIAFVVIIELNDDG